MALSARLSLMVLGPALAAFLGGCALHMPISGDLAGNAREMQVKRKRSFLTNKVKWVHFGPYRVEAIHSHSEATDRKGGFGHAELKAESRYDFKMESAAGTAWKGDCRNHAEREDYFPLLGRAREVGYRISLECNLVPAGGGGPWNMTLVEEDSSGRNLRGGLSDGRSLIQVVGTHAYRGRKALSDLHTGFEFLDDSASLGAVELLGKQMVLLSGETPEEEELPLAAAAAALLLYEDLNARMKEEMRARTGSGLQLVRNGPEVRSDPAVQGGPGVQNDSGAQGKPGIEIASRIPRPFSPAMRTESAYLPDGSGPEPALRREESPPKP